MRRDGWVQAANIQAKIAACLNNRPNWQWQKQAEASRGPRQVPNEGEEKKSRSRPGLRFQVTDHAPQITSHKPHATNHTPHTTTTAASFGVQAHVVYTSPTYPVLL